MGIRTIKVKIGKRWLTTWGIKRHDWCHLQNKNDQMVKTATIHRFYSDYELESQDGVQSAHSRQRIASLMINIGQPERSII